ncbi:MAG: GlsB/YeaQ/YmgE family stress response membrane protein [Pirellulaceae bacterium]|nr:GlsB/YeaQ/YmgE family stress response membrane protein [Pirellulaceae bacterium]
MGEFTSSPAAPPWFLVALIWIGFGTLAGLLARVVLPGRYPSGAVGTMVIGIAGSTLGLLVLHQFLLGESERSTFNPIGVVGMLAAAAGAFALLIVYRILVACVRIDAPPDKDKIEAK